MTSARMRASFASLLRENHDPPAALSADAERAIRGRVAARWTGRGIGLAMVAALGALAVTGALANDATDGDADLALPSPVLTPTVGRAAATFPFDGGPEFEVASSAYRCGDPAPAPHPTEHDLTLEIEVTDAGFDSGVFDPSEGTVVTPYVTKTTDAELGLVSTSGIDLLVVRDGVVVGMLMTNGPNLRLPLDGAADTDSTTSLVAAWSYCPDDVRFQDPGIDPGTYDVIAVANVFSTPESVALAQTLSNSYGAWRLTSRRAVFDPDALYLPGSYDCEYAVLSDAPARPCLADYTPSAAVDTESRMVSLLYDTADLVDEFAVTLVSEPLTAELVDRTVGAYPEGADVPHYEPLDDLSELTCGAIGSGTGYGRGQVPEFNIGLDGVGNGEPPLALAAGATVAGTLLATGVADGSTIELLPGARLVYLDEQTINVQAEDYFSSISVETVVASAPVTMDAPVTADRYTGPQAMSFTADAATVCEGAPPLESIPALSVVVAGTWRIASADGEETTVDAISRVWDSSISYETGG